MNTNSLQHFTTACRAAPVAVVAIAIYVSLRSSSLFPESVNYIRATTPWIPAFFNAYDTLVFACVGLTCLFLGLTPGKSAAICFAVALFGILISLFASSRSSAATYQDALIHWLRFVAAFTFACGLTRRIGLDPVAALLLFFFAILGVSAWFVHQVQADSMTRMYAAGMTVASSAQVATVVGFVAIARRHRVVLVLSTLFIVLTFSVTSTILFLGIAFVVPLAATGFENQIDVRKRMTLRLQQLGLTAALLLGIVCIVGFAAADAGYDLDLTHALTLHGRVPIWTYAVRLIGAGHIGVFGVGFGRTAVFFQDLRLLGCYAPWEVENSHFHSIFVEGILNLGVLSLPLFGFLFWGIWKAWCAKQYLACAILLFFAISQGVDFTMYQPKEEILWGFMLGMANGQMLHWEQVSPRQAEARRRRR